MLIDSAGMPEITSRPLPRAAVALRSRGCRAVASDRDRSADLLPAQRPA